MEQFWVHLNCIHITSVEHLASSHPKYLGEVFQELNFQPVNLSNFPWKLEIARVSRVSKK